LKATLIVNRIGIPNTFCFGGAQVSVVNVDFGFGKKVRVCEEDRVIVFYTLRTAKPSSVERTVVESLLQVEPVVHYCLIVNFIFTVNFIFKSFPKEGVPNAPVAKQQREKILTIGK
jgi:hypothetical protein